MFANARTSDDFAEMLGVPKESIQLVQPTNERCKSKDYLFNAILGNGGRCICHRRTWYPLKNQRGNEILLGSEFLRSNNNGRVCDCKLPACFSAGYFPAQSVLEVPAAGRRTVESTTSLLSDKAKKSQRLYLYPWHFFHVHLEKGKDS